MVTGSLTTIGAILRAAPGFDGEQRADLNLVGGMEFAVDSSGLVNQFQKRLV